MATGLDASSIFFKGADGNECETFIAAIEELAFSEGWSEDRRRMLLFARSRLRNAALRWFAKLDASVKNDWDLFVQTMFDQYPPVASHRGKVVEALTPVWSATTFSPVPSTVTLPATRPEESVEYEIEKHKKSRKESSPKSSTIAKAGKLSQTLSSALLPCYDASGFGIHIGRLRVVYEEKMPPTWIWRGTAPKNAFSKQIPTYNSSGKITLEGSTCGIKSVTLNRLDALLVTFRSEEEPHAIACPDNDRAERLLAVTLVPGFPEFFPLTADTAVANVLKGATFQKGWGNGFWEPVCKRVSSIWNVLDDGTLQATLSDFSQPLQPGTVEASIWTTTTVYVDIAGLPISFAKDDATPRPVDPDTGRPVIKARIVFEPL